MISIVGVRCIDHCSIRRPKMGPPCFLTKTVDGETFPANCGLSVVTIETVVALGVAYVVLGGIILALAASFRLLSDKVDSFFALLIPEPVPRSLRTTGPRGSRFASERVTAVAGELQF